MGQFGNWLYGLDGERITEEEFIELSADWTRTHVARDFFDGYVISTVWVGVSAKEPPEIYETMVFNPAGVPVQTARYADRQTAQDGHRQMMAFVEGYYGGFTDSAETGE